MLRPMPALLRATDRAGRTGTVKWASRRLLDRRRAEEPALRAIQCCDKGLPRSEPPTAPEEPALSSEQAADSLTVAGSERNQSNVPSQNPV